MGRPAYPRDANGNIIRPGDTPGAAGGDEHAGVSTGDATGAERELSDLGERIKRGAGGRFVASGGPDATGTIAGAEAPASEPKKRTRVSQRAKAQDVEPETITVEAPPPKVKAPRPPSGKISAKGAFKAEHVTRTTESMFGMIAMILHRPHWAVQNPKIEVDPWAPAAAELLNKYIPDMDTAERFTDGMAAMSVILGIGGMVAMRYQTDQRIAAQARLQAAQRRRDEMIEQEHRIDPDQPAQASQGPQAAPGGASRNGHVSGTGAAPTSPGKIQGIGGQVF